MRVNLDAASGSRLRTSALEAANSALNQAWADPRAAHAEGRVAAQLLNTSREQVAEIVGCRPEDVSFDASLSAANRRAVRGLAQGRQRLSRRFVVSAVEHSSVLHACAGLADGWLLGSGWEQVTVGVDPTGAIHAEEFVSTVTSEATAFAAVQWANGEVGTRQPAATISAALSDDVPLVLDATAGLGLDDVRLTNWSVLTASGTAIGAPAACSILAVREGVRWRAVDQPTDAYEYGRVPGTPNIAAVSAFASALKEAWTQRTELDRNLRGLTARLRKEIPQLVTDCVVLGAPHDRVAHTVTVSVLYVSGAALAAELDAAGFAVGSGSACTSDALQPSHVLAAMGALTEGNLRLSLPWHTTTADIDAFLRALPSCVARVRERFGSPV